MDTFQSLYSDEYKAVRAYVRRIVGDYHLAEDATSEAFIDLWRRESTDTPLLYRIAERRAVDALRRGENDPVSYGDEEDFVAFVAPETVSRAEFRADFDTAVRGLEGPERDAYILTELRGLTTREAAGVLDTSHMTVHRRAESARNIVAKEIAA